MKRILPLLAAVVLLAGAFSLLVSRKERAADPLDFLPRDTLLLVDVRKPADLYKEFRQSRLGQRIGTIRWVDLLRRFGASEEEAAALQGEVDQVQTFLDGPLFRELFARRAVLALLPAESGSNDLAAPWETLVLIAHPRHRTEVVELLAPLLSDDNQYATETYQGREIRTFFLANDGVLAVAAGDGLLLASLSAATLKRCLDLASRQPVAGTSRLNDNSDYLSMRKRAGGLDEQFVYGDVQAMTRLVHRVSSSWPGLNEQKALPGGGEFSQGAFFCGTGMDRLECTAILQTEPDRTKAGIPLPAFDDTLAVTPAELLLHYWTNLLDLPRLAAGMKRIPQFSDSLGRSEEWLARKSGLTFSDFFLLFDRQISLTVTGMRGSGFFPLPRFFGRLTVKDEVRLRQALTALLKGKPQTSKEVAGVQIHTLMLAGGLLQPSWAIRGEKFFFADSPEQLEQALSQPMAPLSESPRFRRVNIGLQEKNNMTAYVNYPQFLEGLQQGIAWGATILAMVDQERGGRAMALVDLVVTPFLDGMKTFAAGSSRLVVKPSEMVMESALVFADQAEKGE